VRKVVEKNGGTLLEERIYLGGFEIFRRSGVGGEVSLERETLHITDEQRRIALVETRTLGNDGSPAQVVRYQIGNHLDSASLELDEIGQIISYEEYYPYGSSAYQAGRSATEVRLKRFRFTGMERDEETGFSVHGRRYYMPWLGRWVNTDPIGVEGGGNLYAYAFNNPVMLQDPMGTQPGPPANLPRDENGNYILPPETIEVHDTAPPLDIADEAQRSGFSRTLTRDQFERIRAFEVTNSTAYKAFWTEEMRAAYWRDNPEEAAERWYGPLQAEYNEYWNKEAAATKNSLKILHSANVIVQGVGWVTIGAITLGHGVAKAGFIGFGKQLATGGVFAALTSSGGFEGCGMLASLGGGALPKGAAPAATRTAATESATVAGRGPAFEAFMKDIGVCSATNCVNRAIAVDLRLAGTRNVYAAESAAWSVDDVMRKLPQLYPQGAFTTYSTSGVMERAFLKAGEGTRGIVLGWSGRIAASEGHAFNAIVSKGRVHFLDSALSGPMRTAAHLAKDPGFAEFALYGPASLSGYSNFTVFFTNIVP
jgi:RHS repeat-associated protein